MTDSLHYNIIQSIFTTLKIPCSAYPSPPTPHNKHTPLATIDFFIISLVLPFPECQAVGIIQNIASPWLLSLSNTHLSFFHDFFFFSCGIFLIAVHRVFSCGMQTLSCCVWGLVPQSGQIQALCVRNPES